MFAITDFQFWLAFVGFLIAVTVSFYLPGVLVLNRIDTKISVRNFILSLCLGYVLWTFQGYIFGYMQMRWLSYLFLIIVIAFSLPHIQHIRSTFIYLFQRVLQNKLVACFIFIGMILQSQIMFGSGFMTNEGMRFLGTNYIDGLMHMGYIQEMITTFPPKEPGANSLPLINYHYWMDLNIAELSRVWYLPAHHIFFQFIPLFFSVITGMATFLLMRMWTGSKAAGLWALFFLYFGGDAAYLFMLALHQKFGFYTPAIDNGISQFYNMPHAAAKMIFMCGLVSFYNWIRFDQKKWGLLSVLFFAPLVGFKVYFGIFAALGFTLVVLGKIVVGFIKAKKERTFLKKSSSIIQKESVSVFLLLLFAAIASAIYFPPNASSGGLVYYPLEWPKLFLGQHNLDLREWWLRMQVYEEAGNIRNIIIYNTFAAIVGLICIHGTRLIGLFPHKNLFKLLGWQHMVFFLPGIILFQILGLFTLQKAGSFNVFNFFVVSTTVMALFTAYLMYALSQKKRIWATALVLVVVILTVPRAFYEINASAKTILTNTGGIITSQELEALDYIRSNTPSNAIVQSHPMNKLDSMTTYVAYFSGRDAYISGIMMIESHGQPTDPLEQNLSKIFSLTDAKVFADEAKKAQIQYLYLHKTPEQRLNFRVESSQFVKRFENNDVIILEIKD
jgi:hypothetical protein